MQITIFPDSDIGRFTQDAEELGTTFPEPEQILVLVLSLMSLTLHAQYILMSDVMLSAIWLMQHLA